MYPLLHPSIHHHYVPIYSSIHLFIHPSSSSRAELPSSRAKLISGSGGLNITDVVKIISGPVGLNAGPCHSLSVKIKAGSGGLNAGRENRTGPSMDNFTTSICDGAYRCLLVQDAELRQGQT
jgi:hypothetical protein